jgi:energy-converting hydrogenase Eha subunit F
MKVDFKLETEDPKTANLLIVMVTLVVIVLGVLVYSHYHPNQNTPLPIKDVPELINTAKDMM